MCVCVRGCLVALNVSFFANLNLMLRQYSIVVAVAISQQREGKLGTAVLATFFFDFGTVYGLF